MAKNVKKNEVVKAQAPVAVAAVELPTRSWFVPMGFAVRVEHPVTEASKQHAAYAEYQGTQILEKVEEILAAAGIKVYVSACDAAYVGETASGMAARAKMAPPPVPGATPVAAPAAPAAPVDPLAGMDLAALRTMARGLGCKVLGKDTVESLKEKITAKSKTA